MLRTALSQYPQTSRAVASSSSKPLAQLHTSAPLCIASDRRRQLRGAKHRQEAKQREVGASRGRPHVVLGYRPGDEGKWTGCDLAKVIITEEQVHAAAVHKGSEPPKFVNYGIGEKEKKLLFDVLPDLTVDAIMKSYNLKNTREILTKAEETVEFEQYKAEQFATLVDLRNANAAGLAFENRKRIVAAFSEPGKPNDTGLPEVQAAIMTMRIRTVWKHLNENRKDVIARRNLRQLVHQRAKMLKYLKQLDRDRYDAVLVRLGLEPESVEGELVV